MNKAQFEPIAKELEKRLNTPVELYTYSKTNDVEQVGLAFPEHNFGFGGILENLYNSENSFDEQVNILIKEFHTGINKLDEFGIDEKLFNIDFLKANVYCKLVNAEQNKDRLQNLLHTKILDLAITYHLPVGEDKDTIASACITNNMLEHIECDIEELKQIALKNSFAMCEEISLSQLMLEMLKEFGTPDDASFAFDNEDVVEPVYVIKAKGKYDGAINMFNTDVLDKYATKFNSDLAIIPSSIHEIIVTPYEMAVSSGTTSMVDSVNAHCLSDTEVLSDHAYKYNRTLKQVTCL